MSEQTTMLTNIQDLQNIQIKNLTKEEILFIYTTYSVKHFPADELKPAASIERMYEEGIYKGYGLYSTAPGQQLLCYAFFTILPDRKNILLDYFAVLEDYRSQGIGSLFLAHMKSSVKDYNGFFIESEDPDYAINEPERLIRNKRIAFYERNHAVFTGLKAEVFRVHYKVLFFPILTLPDTAILYHDFDRIYQHMVSNQNYKTQIHIYMP